MAASPAPASEVYTWEPSNASIARRYGLRPDRILRFDTNTSPFPPDGVAAILAGPFDPPLNEYPDSEYAELTEAISAYSGVPSEEIVVGAGADEILDLIAKAFLTDRAAALIPTPTYSMYGVVTSHRGAGVVVVPRRGPAAAFVLYLPALIARLADVAVVWLCAPNNPTGANEPREVLEAVVDAAEGLGDSRPVVVVDEAYHEFTGETVVPLRSRYPKLVVVRTLSKAFALAGIRVGYGISSRPTIARLERVRPPGSVSTLSAGLAAAALRRSSDARANVARIEAERERLGEALRGVGFRPYPTATNFLLVPIGTHAEAEAAAESLLRAGIVPRTFGPANPLRGHLRLTVRSAPENDRLLEVMSGWSK